MTDWLIFYWQRQYTNVFVNPRAKHGISTRTTFSQPIKQREACRFRAPIGSSIYSGIQRRKKREDRRDLILLQSNTNPPSPSIKGKHLSFPLIPFHLFRVSYIDFTVISRVSGEINFRDSRCPEPIKFLKITLWLCIWFGYCWVWPCLDLAILMPFRFWDFVGARVHVTGQ